MTEEFLPPSPKAPSLALRAGLPLYGVVAGDLIAIRVRQRDLYPFDALLDVDFSFSGVNVCLLEQRFAFSLGETARWGLLSLREAGVVRLLDGGRGYV